MKTGVKLCMAISAVGRPAAWRAVELGLDALVIGLEDFAHPGGALGRGSDRDCRESPSSSLSVTIELSTEGSRLLSITRRE